MFYLDVLLRWRIWIKYFDQVLSCRLFCQTTRHTARYKAIFRMFYDCIVLWDKIPKFPQRVKKIWYRKLEAYVIRLRGISGPGTWLARRSIWTYYAAAENGNKAHDTFNGYLLLECFLFWLSLERKALHCLETLTPPLFSFNLPSW